jgi:lysophospholipid acyltransferase (LPLAT)-like uncharacterized protein
LNPQKTSLWDRLILFAVPRVASAAIRLVRATSRIEQEIPESIRDARRRRSPVILAFWHGRLFLMPYAYTGRNIAILISEHRDGELISRTMNRFGFTTSRGSTTRRGAAGLRDIVRRILSGSDAAFTPDGPRGPREVVQPGVIAAARLSGAPIVPVTFSCSKKNFSIRGIASCFPSPSGAGCSSTASRFA